MRWPWSKKEEKPAMEAKDEDRKIVEAEAADLRARLRVLKTKVQVMRREA
jgi:hypothetical protein